MAWGQIKLGDLFEQYRVQHMVQNDKDYGQITISKNGYIKFRASKNGKNIGRKRQFILDLQKHPNTLLFTRQGVSEGAIAFAPIEVDGCIATENMPMFSLKNNVDRKFVELLLKSKQYINEVKKLTPIGSAQKSIHERDLMQILLVIPNEEEQKEISRKLDNHLNDIKVLNTEILNQQKLLKKLKQSILQEAIEGKLTTSWREQNKDVESAFVLLEKIKAEKEQLIKDKKIKKQKPLPPINQNEIPFDIPNGWEWSKLGDIAILITKGSSPKWQGISYVDESQGILFITSENIGNNRLITKNKKYVESEFNNIEPRSILQIGDILTNIVGASIGRTAIYDIYDIANINQAVCLIRLNIFYKQFVVNYLNSNIGIKYMLENQFSPGRANLSLVNMSNMLVPVPALQEQKEIAKKIKTLFKICDELETQINHSKTSSETLIKAVLKEAFETENKNV